MGRWSKDKGNRGQEHHTAEQGITRGKNFTGSRLHMIYGPHTGKYH